MKQIKGFVTSSLLISNSLGATNPFFELSPLSLTYSKSRAEYQHTSHPGRILNTFQSVNGSSYFVLNTTEINEALNVVAQILSYASTYPAPYSLPDFENAIQVGLNNTIQNVTLGPIITESTSTLPAWVSWTDVSLSRAVKIWIHNESFEEQYLEYEIVPVLPVNNIDTLYSSYGSTIAALTSSSYNFFDRIAAARNDIPESYLRGYRFKCYNYNNPSQYTLVDFAALVYGRNGDNVDSIKDAIQDYILTHSSQPQSVWEVILPAVFKRTEFLFIPRWDKISIANLNDLSSLYSSILSPKECLTFAKAKWSSYSPTYVESNLTTIPFDYKGISLLCLDGSNNIVTANDLLDLYADYIPVGTATLDFNRMSLATKNWVLGMEELIRAAETASDSVGVDNPLRKVTRNNIIYVSKVINNINYLVATRYSITGDA